MSGRCLHCGRPLNAVGDCPECQTCYVAGGPLKAATVRVVPTEIAALEDRVDRLEGRLDKAVKQLNAILGALSALCKLRVLRGEKDPS